MEKVWEELKKIEAQAQQIKIDAQEKAKEITQQAKQDADRLVADSKHFADEEANKRYTQAITEANDARDAQLKINHEATETLRIQAQKNLDKAVDSVVKSVLED
jgi:F0F1-type ATP synthase membrane subunit b/b'